MQQITGIRSIGVRWGVLGLMVLLFGYYIFLNQPKVTKAVEDWRMMLGGEPAPLVSIKIGDARVWQKPLMSTGFYDGDGRKQVYYLSLTTALIEQLNQDQQAVTVYVEGFGQAPLIFDAQGVLARADMKIKRLYFATEDNFSMLAKAAWNENINGWGNVRCLPASLCNDVSVSSNEWSQVGGPYLRTDLVKERRGLPRGRWTWGPKTDLVIQSTSSRKVLVQVNIYSLMPEQKITFSGIKGLQVKEARVRAGLLKTDYWTLYPHSYRLLANLQPGDNHLTMMYSNWLKPAAEGGYPFAAYLSTIIVKALN